MKPSLTLLCLIFFVSVCNLAKVSGQNIRVGEPELLYTADELPIRYDGTISTLRKDGNTMYFFHSFGCRLTPEVKRRSRHSWHYGPPEDPLKHHHLSKTEEEFWDYNGFYQDTKQEGIWILGIYERDNGDLLAITHSEINYTNERSEQRFALGLGYSTDRGDSWTYCGEIVKPADDRRNVGGGAFILKDDYLYVYYNDIEPEGREPLSCVARANLGEVLDAAEKHQVTDWYKYKDGKWDVHGLSGKPGTDIIPRVYGREDLHADAAYCEPLGKYLLTVQTHGTAKLLLFASEDGVSWQQVAIVDETDEPVLQPYAAFVDFNSPRGDGRIVGNRFYIYFPRKLLSDHNIDEMYRVLITIDN